jgi:hypothetical protein
MAEVASDKDIETLPFGGSDVGGGGTGAAGSSAAGGSGSSAG